MKKLVYGFAFLAIGTFAMAQQQPVKADAKANKEQKRAEHLAEMQKELNLTPTQVAQIKTLHEKHYAEREQQRAKQSEMKKQMAEDKEKGKQQMEAEMKKILTPEQFAQWKAKKEEKHKGMEQKRKHLKETNKDRKWGQTPSKS